MIRFLINVAIFLASAALGLWLASLILGEDFSLPAAALIYATVIFAIIQALLSPFFFKMTARYANALIGGVGLVATFFSLWITTLIVSDFSISGASTWIIATLIVWLVTALATWVLPLIFLKNRRAEKA